MFTSGSTDSPLVSPVVSVTVDSVPLPFKQEQLEIINWPSV